MDTYIVMDTHTLLDINRASRSRHFNRTLSQAFILKIDPDGKHIVTFSFIHNDDHIRAMMLVKMSDRMEPTVATIDIELDTFLKLPRYGYDEHGDLVDVNHKTVIKREDRVTIRSQLGL
jgi:hypothetical protein